MSKDYTNKSPEEKAREIYDFFIEFGKRTMGADAYSTIRRQFELRFPEFSEHPLSVTETAYAKIELFEVIAEDLKGLKAKLEREIKKDNN